MKKVGLITFHAAHNNGSILQAYATQKYIQNTGYDCEVINYRLKMQRAFYTLYRTRYGKTNFISDALMLPVHFARQKRARKFEDFLRYDLKLSSVEYTSAEELEKADLSYDICVTGSDQVWNYNVPEIITSGAKSILPYFLHFANCKRISYASSIGNMKTADLSMYQKLLQKYDHISTREKNAISILEPLVDKPVESVIDPTFLLDRKDWSGLITEKRLIDEPYVLLYSIFGLSKGVRWSKGLLPFAKRLGLKIVCVTPFFPVLAAGVTNYVSAGPKDFLNLFKNAEVVCTDTFHGIAFSIIFRKPFYALGNKYWKADIRKQALLGELELMDRLIEDEIDLAKIHCCDIDYSRAESILTQKIKHSKQYLESALSDGK